MTAAVIVAARSRSSCTDVYIPVARSAAPRQQPPCSVGRESRLRTDRGARSRSSSQRGWVGLIVLLLALLIVAMLAQTALKRYGLVDAGREAPARAARAPGLAAPQEEDATTATPPPKKAIERARGVEADVRKQADDLEKRIDDSAK